MSKRNAETFTAICDSLCNDPSLTRACEVNGVGVSTVFRWLKDCTNDPTPYTFEYGEYGVLTFPEAVKLAQRIATVIHVSELRHRARFGTPEVVVFAGRLQYADNPQFVGWSDDEMEALGFDPKRDRILFDKNNRPVPLTVVRPPSDALQIAVARTYDPAWVDRKEVALQHSGGVMVVGAKQAPTHAAIPAPVVTQVIEQVVEEVIDAREEIAAEDVAATEAEEISDTELIPSTEPPSEAEAPNVPEVSTDLDPASVQEADRADDVPPKPYAAELAALEKKLAAAKEKTAAAAPTAGRYPTLAERGLGHLYAKHDTSEEDHVGRGTPKPNGQKMA